MQKSSSWTLSFWRTGFQLPGFLHRKVDRCSVVRIIGSWSFKALLGCQKLHSSFTNSHSRKASCCSTTSKGLRRTIKGCRAFMYLHEAPKARAVVNPEPLLPDRAKSYRSFCRNPSAQADSHSRPPQHRCRTPEGARLWPRAPMGSAVRCQVS